MAIAFDAATTQNVSATSLTFAHTTSGSNRILWLGANQQDSAGTYSLTGCTYAGVSMTQAGSTQASTNPYQTSLWYLIAPSTGSNNVVISASTSRAILGFASSYTGAKQTGQPDATNGSNFTSSTMTLSVTTIADNCWLVASWVGNREPFAGTATNRRLNAGGNGLFDSNGAKTPAGSYSIQVTQSDGATAAMAMASFAPSLPPATYKFFQMVEKA
jgi:hypothetical protein